MGSQIASSATLHARHQDIDCPRDEIALIGFDDIAFAAAAAVPITSIRQPSGMIGRTALRILLEECDDADLIPRQTVFQPELVVRRSTATRA